MDCSNETQAADTKFKPGTSGNPKGRPPGSGFAGKAREDLQKAWDGDEGKPGIRAKLIELALAGDVVACKLVAERVCSPLKPVEPTAALDLQGETLADKALAVIVALAGGGVPTSQASQLLDGLATLAKIVETEQLKQRIEALEKTLKEQGHGRL